MSRSADKQRRRQQRKAKAERRRKQAPGPGYDADKPLPTSWLTHPDKERLRRVMVYHRRALPSGKQPPDAEAHARLHVLVEDMNAAHDPPTVSAAMERLLADGMKRHDAVHAVAFILSRHLEDGSLPDEAREVCETELAQLTRERFEQLIGLR